MHKSKEDPYSECMVTGLIVLIALVLAISFWFVGIRNRLIELRNEVQCQWSNVDLELTRRDELIREAAGYPASIMEDARSACEAATRKRQSIWQLGGPIGASLDQLIVAEEAINALELKQLLLGPELNQAEQQLQKATQRYNQAVAHYNHRLTQAPASWLARLGGHRPADLFTISAPVLMTPVAT